MGTTLENGIYLPDEGERNCYDGLAGNWVALDNHLGSTNIHVTINDKQAWDGHVADTTIHVTSADKQTWNSHVADTTIHVTSADKQAWNGHVADLVKHVTAEDKNKWDAVTSKADDSDVVHKSGNEYITDTKTFGKGTLIVDNSTGSNVHGEIKLNGSRSGYIVADSTSDGVFNTTSCGISILLKDSGKPLHVGGYKVDANGRVFADNTNKNPVLTVKGGSIKSSILIPENDTSDNEFTISSELTYANGNPSKTLVVVFRQYDNADATNAIYSNTNNVTSLGIPTRRWSDVQTYKVNALEPSSLSLPDLNNGIDISSYITVTDNANVQSTYTPPSNGWVCVKLSRTSGAFAVLLQQENICGYGRNTTLIDGTTIACSSIPVIKGVQVLINSGLANGVVSAYFYPCQGNV